MAAGEAKAQVQGVGMQEQAGVQQVRLTSSVVLAVLGGLGQGEAGLRTQGLEGVELGQDQGASVGCSPPPQCGLLAWALAAASYEEKSRGWVEREKGIAKERKKDEAERL